MDQRGPRIFPPCAVEEKVVKAGMITWSCVFQMGRLINHLAHTSWVVALLGQRQTCRHVCGGSSSAQCRDIGVDSPRESTWRAGTSWSQKGLSGFQRIFVYPSISKLNECVLCHWFQGAGPRARADWRIVIEVHRLQTQDGNQGHWSFGKIAIDGHQKRQRFKSTNKGHTFW